VCVGVWCVCVWMSVGGCVWVEWVCVGGVGVGVKVFM
jgi:hypothetical protein